MFTSHQEFQIIDAIRTAELQTTGEIRVYVEDYCFYDHPVQRAAEVFHLNQMDKTVHRNGVLIYIASLAHQFAIFGDIGVFDKEPIEFWTHHKAGAQSHFKEGKFVEGVIYLIEIAGAMLAKHFPLDGTRHNELPDEIIYG